MPKTLIISDRTGNQEALTDFKNLKRSRGVNGEKLISFTSFFTRNTAHSFPLVQEESIVDCAGEPFVIKVLIMKSAGSMYYKEVVAIHKFFDDMRNKQMYTSFTRSFTFNDILTEVFRNTGYTFSIEGVFLAEDWENFGKKNRLALFQEVLKRYQSEFEIAGTVIKLKKKIGRSEIDFQFRFNHNIKTLNYEVNTKNLATYIKGYGKRDEDGNPIITAEYTSPNVAIFGIIEADPIDDERFTTTAGLQDALEEALIDEPEISITLDFVDLRGAGYPYEIPYEGDETYLIHEPMGLDTKVRLMQIEEDIDINLEVTNSRVTLANMRKSMADAVFDVNKSIRDLLDNKGRVKFSVLDEAVQIATAALKSAQTELIFENGIIARSKDDPNFLVLVNSAGIGISDNGGATFREAITGAGFVLSAGAIGRLAADHIQIGAETLYEEGYNPIAVEAAAKQYADNLLTSTNAEIGDLRQELLDLDTYIDSSFKNGVISAAEAKAIEKYLNSVNAEKADVDAKYSDVYNNADLTGTTKSTLLTRKNEFNTAHTNLINSINVAIADGLTTPTEKADVDSKFVAYHTALANISTAFEKAITTIGVNRANAALASANQYSDQMKLQIDQEISDINTAITDLDTYVNGAFEDGVISQAEAVAIEKYINTVNSEKADADNRYTIIYANADLTGTDKTNLASKKTAYNTSHTNLINAINTAIADMTTTPAEKTDVNTKFADYRTKLSELSSAFESAINRITQVKADKSLFDAKAYSDQLLAPITQDITDLETRFTDLDTYMEGTFSDGIVSEAESNRIKGLLEQLQNERGDLDNRYTEIYNNSDNTIVRKADLKTAYDAFVATYNEVVREINATIADGLATPQEILSMNYDLDDYGVKLKALSTEFEKSVNAIAQKKADIARDAAKTHTDTRFTEDLRLTAPLPNVITMNADGIRATAAGNPNRYASMDYRGFFGKGGMFSLERPDGALWIENGLAKLDYSVQSHYPNWQGSGVLIEGSFYKTPENVAYHDIGYFNFKHTARYLVIVAYLKVTSQANGALASMRIANANATDDYWGYGTSGAVTLAGEQVIIRLDLGIPNFSRKSFYVQLRTTVGFHPAFARILQMYLED